MGQIHSQVLPGSLYNVNPRRCRVHELQCYLNEGDQTFAAPIAKPVSSTLLLSAKVAENTGDAYPCVTAERLDCRPLSFVLDPESNNMILQLPYQPSFTFRFIISASVAPGDEPTKLMFAHAGSAEELQQAITQRQTGNWFDVAKFTETSQHKEDHIEFVFVWDAMEDKEGGQPVHFAFFFDDQGPASVVNPPDSAIQLNSGGALWIAERPQREFATLFEPVTQPSPTEIAAPYTPYPSSTVAPVHIPTSTVQQQQPQTQQTQQTQQSIALSQSPSQRSTASGGAPGPGSAPSGGDLKMPYGVPLGPHRNRTPQQAFRPTVEHQFQSEDGPQFRSAIASMERRVPQLKARTKQLLKRSLISRERLQALVEADSWLAAGLQEAARAEFSVLQPLTDWFSRHSEGGLSAIQRQRKAALNELTTRIVEPLQQFYEYDIKIFEPRKREFEEESSQFYSWTSRYLSARKEVRRGKTPEVADTKFAIKKRSFDAARFEYFQYLSDLTVGLKQQVLLQLLALAAQSLTDSHIALGTELATRTQPQLDEIVTDIKNAAKEWEKYRLDAINYRQSINEDIGVPFNGGLPSAGPGPGPGAVPNSSECPTSPEPPTPIPATPYAPAHNYKEGLLWASSRPGGVQETLGTNKQTTLQNLKWHKYWVVLDGSSLREYTNWKQSVDLHNEPINLLVAGVREARNSDRRFCFEVVTPQYKRVYQATSEDDMRSWITAIHNSVSTLLEGTDDQQKHNPSVNQNPNQNHQSNHVLAPMASSPVREPGIEIAKRNNNLANHQTGDSNNNKPGGERIDYLTRKLSLKGEKPRVPPIITNMATANQQPIIGSPMMINTQQAIQPQFSQPNTMDSGPNGNSRQHSGSQQYLQQSHHSQEVNSPTSQLTPSASSPFDELLVKIHRSPSNRMCAECGATKTVEWVSINLLIVLCIECSGAHRSLGSHISKVRSLTLDTGAFTPSLKAALLSVSNELMNRIWEAKMHRERKISSDAPSQARVKFVTEKYVEKLYIDEVEKPNAALRRAISERDIPKMCAALASRANPNGVSDDNEPMLIHALRSALPTDKTFPAAEVLIKNGATVPPIGSYAPMNELAEEYLAQKRTQP